MSIELEQLRKVARQTDIGYLRDDGTVETISLSAIVARLEAAEAVVELARQFMAWVDTMEETYAGKRPWKNIQVVMRQNAECLAAKDALCAAIRKS